MHKVRDIRSLEKSDSTVFCITNTLHYLIQCKPLVLILIKYSGDLYPVGINCENKIYESNRKKNSITCVLFGGG